jgi:hypothetical protein
MNRALKRSSWPEQMGSNMIPRAWLYSALLNQRPRPISLGGSQMNLEESLRRKTTTGECYRFSAPFLIKDRAVR